MKKGYNWGVEWKRDADIKTGVEVVKLCDHAAHSHHFYFTNPGWHDHNNRLVFGGDRMNCSNLFSIDLRSGEITQLTGFADRPDGGFILSCVNLVTNEVNFWHDRKLWALSLDTLEEHLLWTLPQGRNGDMLNPTADGKFIMTITNEDLSGRLKLDLLHGYLGMNEYWAAKPLCHVVRVPVDGSGKAEILHAGNVWMGHMNTSSTQPAHLTFCHEGPWNKVENRIWAMDTATGKVWPLREHRNPDECVGHEYWLADGERVGYQVFDKGKKTIGTIRHDGTDCVEHEFPCHSTHVHSNDESVIVGDGAPGGISPGNSMKGDRGCVLLWKKNAAGYDPTRIVCIHRCSMHIQTSHVHPRLSPDGSHVLFTSDKSGYASPYIAKLPKDISTLPFAEGQESAQK